MEGTLDMEETMIACLKHNPVIVEFPTDMTCPLCAAQAEMAGVQAELTAIQEELTGTQMALAIACACAKQTLAIANPLITLKEWTDNVRPGGQL
jgi:hypothetical protein